MYILKKEAMFVKKQDGTIQIGTLKLTPKEGKNEITIENFDIEYI